MKYLKCVLFLITILMLAGCDTASDEIANRLNPVSEELGQQMESTQETVDQVREDAGTKFRAFLAQAADVVSGAAEGAKAKLEEQASE